MKEKSVEKELSEQEKDLLYLFWMETWMILLKTLEDSNVLIDGITETVKHEIKKESGFLTTFLAPSAASLLLPVFS